jgi:hypothetical protein
MAVTLEHEGLALLFRNRPSLAAEVLDQVFGVPLQRPSWASTTTGCVSTKTS